MIGGPRDGGYYTTPDGYKEEFGDIRVAYIKDDMSTGVALYRRRMIVTPQKTIRPTDEMEFVRYEK
jgi:hypothetical protein